MITPFKSMNFVLNEVITKDELDTMQTNLQWLLDNTPRGRFIQENGRPVDVRSVIVSGREDIPASKNNSTVKKSVTFPKAFYVNCRPNVTTAILTDAEPEVFCVVSGPGNSIVPTATGFEITVTVNDQRKKKEDWRISKPFHIYWQAFGYRASDVNDL